MATWRLNPGGLLPDGALPNEPGTMGPPPSPGAETGALHPLTILLNAAGALRRGADTMAPPPAPGVPVKIPAPGPEAPQPPAIPWGAEPPAMPGPSADVDRPVVAPPVNSDLFGRIIRGALDANPVTAGLPPEVKDRGASIFRLWADQAWRENSMAGTVVSNLESGVHESPEALRRLPPGSVGPHNIMLRKPIGQQSNYMDARPPEVQQNLAERYDRKKLAYDQDQAQKRDQMRALGPLSTGEQIGAVLSSIIGSALSPETAVGPGAATYAKAGTAGKMALGAGVNAATVGITDPIAQTEAVARGDKKEFSPAEWAMATGGAAGLGALIPALGALARRFGVLREAPVEPPRAEAPPEAPREPVTLPSEKVGQPATPGEQPDLRYTEEGVPIIRITPEKKTEAPAPAQPAAKPDPVLQKMIDDSLERAGVKPVPAEAPKPATEPAIAEAPRAPEVPAKPVDGPFNRGVEAPPKADVPAVVEKPPMVYDRGAPRKASPYEAYQQGYRSPVDKVDGPRESAGMQPDPVLQERMREPGYIPGKGTRHESYWEYKAPPTPTVAELPPGAFKGTQADFEKLSPGMRREILRDAERRAKVESQATPTRAAEQPPDIPDFLRRPMPGKTEPKPEPSEPITAPERTSPPDAAPDGREAQPKAAEAKPSAAAEPSAPPKPAEGPVGQERPQIEVGKERLTNGRPEIEYRGPFGKNGEAAPVMNASYVVTAERGAKAGDKSWVVERRYYDYSGNSKYGGRQVQERLTPGLTKKEARDFALRASQAELDSAGRADFKPTKYTSREYVQPGDPVLVKNGETWQLGRALETDIHGRVTRADVGGKQIDVQRGESARFGEELRSGYETLMKRHGDKTWATPQDAKQALIKWRNKTLAGPHSAPPPNAAPKPDTPAAKPAPAHPGEYADGIKELNASFGLTPAMAKAMGPEMAGAFVGGMYDFDTKTWRPSWQGALVGALAVAALRRRIPGISKSVIGKSSFATDALEGAGSILGKTWGLRNFHPTHGAPKGVYDAIVRARVETRNLQDDALKIGRYIRQNFTPEERITISDWIERRNLQEHGSDAWKAADDRVKAAADALSAHVDALGEQLVKHGGLSKEAFESLRGEYLHRYYMAKQAKDPGFRQAAKRMQATATYAMRRGQEAEATLADAANIKKGDTLVEWASARTGEKQWLRVGEDPGVKDGWFPGRQWTAEKIEGNKVSLHRDYTPEERASMGEIRDANYRFVMGTMEAARDVGLFKLFATIQANPAWASRVEKAGWVRVPLNKVGDSEIRKFGNLAGYWVPPEVMSALRTTRKPWTSEEWGLAGRMIKGYLKMLQAWKVGKTAYNPATHFNNLMGNVGLSMLTGEVTPLSFMKAAGALKRKDAIVEEARRAGLSLNREAMLGDELHNVQVDVGLATGTDPQTAWQRAMAWYLDGPVTRLYQSEDSVFKLAAYMGHRQSGKTPEQAVEAAHRVFFDYSDVPLGVQLLRDTYAPFFTYTYKFGQLALREVAERPWRAASMYAGLTAMNMMSYGFLYGDKAGAVEELERELLPKWQKGRTGVGSQRMQRLPWNEPDIVTGQPRSQFLNMRYMVPGGDILDIFANGKFGPEIWPQALGNTMLGGNPFINFALGVAQGRDTFFDKPLVPYKDTGLTSAMGSFSASILEMFPGAKPALEQARVREILTEKLDSRPAREVAANFGAYVRFAAMQALPPILTTVPDKLGQAATGEGLIDKDGGLAQFMGWTGTDYAGRQRTVAKALLSAIGIKVEDLGIDEQMSFREAELKRTADEAKRDMLNAHRNESKTTTQREGQERRVEDRYERMDREVNRLNTLRSRAGQ